MNHAPLNVCLAHTKQRNALTRPTECAQRAQKTHTVWEVYFFQIAQRFAHQVSMKQHNAQTRQTGFARHAWITHIVLVTRLFQSAEIHAK